MALLKKRQKARKLALQALYQWQINPCGLPELLTQFQMDPFYTHIEQPYFQEVLTEITEQPSHLDELFASILDRPVKELDPIALCILRIGCYELKSRLDIPYRVCINESVELAKTFGAEKSHKYINSILDKVAQNCRQQEYIRTSQ